MMKEENEKQKPADAKSFGEAKKSDVALREEAILKFWRENKIFEKSLKQTEGKKEFIFFEGPPTANGKPGIHHLEARAFKDAIPRYKTMQGFYVRRKGGWDTHGLAVEIQTEKKLGLNSKKAIEEYGIAKFNQECKESVWEYLDVWNKFTKRIGYWLDQDNPFVTYNNNYIESVWNVLKNIDDKKLLYKDYKVVPWCPRCGTALSSHELAQGYEEDIDLSVYVKFKLKPGQKIGNYQVDNNTFILSWTTTPWTLPGNVALAVGKDMEYVKIQMIDHEKMSKGEREIINVIISNEIYLRLHDANDKNPLKIALGLTYPVLDDFQRTVYFKGSDLLNLEYYPLFPDLAEYLETKPYPPFSNDRKKGWKIYPARFVNAEDGTGIVHTAVMYGQDDFELGNEFNLPKFHTVTQEGIFNEQAPDFLRGRYVKEKGENNKPILDLDIIEELKKKGFFFTKENYKHSYPHCWRCHTALIYYARDSWYIKMSDAKIKKELIEENKKINWEPSHIKDGRFGEWLREIKDWAISRERYWGTPLPVWHCASCKKLEVVGSIADLKEKTKKSGNKYFVMRHGGSEGNLKGLVSCDVENVDHLTEDGKKQVLKSISELKGKKIDLIISSLFMRTKETAEIVKKELGLGDSALIFDNKLWELNAGVFNNKTWQEYFDFRQGQDWYSYVPEKGESYKNMKSRMASFIYETEKKYENKNILIVTHEGPARTLFATVQGLNDTETIQQLESGVIFFNNAQISTLDFSPIPHNENYELDLHKPYIDEISLICAHSTDSGQACGGNLIRTKEVMDVWFDSGAMPFAQDHYPFDFAQGKPSENKKLQYPADYISEAVDQTRGWFYTLHAIGILMGRGLAYKNVICLGHLLDAQGKKMSKSVGNVVDPWVMIEKYGVDTLRLWMYSVNQPGESKNFDEKTVLLLQQQVFGLLYNVLAFYELYRENLLEPKAYGLKPTNVLDIWILARLDELIKLSTESLDNYKLLEPVRGIRDFIGDLSTWYLRRSRERIKEGDEEAKQTLYFVLKTIAKIIAPFAPFTAEDIWQKLKTQDDVESVHLAEWPSVKKNVLSMFGGGKNKIIEDMESVRKIVTLGLEARQKANIKVRQPLASLEVKSLELGKEYVDLIRDELNVKLVLQNENIENEVVLDTNITSALKAEGEYREFMRELQDMRKQMGLNPSDKMPVSINMIYKKYKIVPILQEHMLRVAAVASLICDNFDEPLSKEEIVTACLLHDMGNILKFKWDSLLEFLEPEGISYWQNVQNEYIEKYGNNEEQSHEKILQELGVSSEIISLVNQVRFSLLCNHKDSDDMSMKIIHYADMRVSPYGVVSLEARMLEANNRYKLKSKIEEDERTRLKVCCEEIEKQIFTKCKIKPEDINNETVSQIISKLRDFTI